MSEPTVIQRIEFTLLELCDRLKAIEERLEKIEEAAEELAEKVMNLSLATYDYDETSV